MRVWWIRFVKFGLPLLAAAMLGVAAAYVTIARMDVEDKSPPISPQSRPFQTTVAGAGVVEAKTENIEVAAPVPDVVETVHVEVNQQVKRGDPLFTLETRPLKAERDVRKADLAYAQAELERLSNEPRQERLPVARATVAAAEARLESLQDSYARLAVLIKDNAVPEEEYIASKLAVAEAEARLRQVESELKLLEAGAWEYELQVSRRKVEQARAALESVETEIERRTVRAPTDGTVLRVEIEPGEFVGAPPGQPMVVMGDIHTLHIRVDIDEHDIPRYRQDAPAVAMPRGGTDVSYKLDFVRVEPFVVPKRSLTGRTTERVDTRVLQIIYAVDDPDAKLYVGQQVDIYVDLSTDSTSLPRT